MTSQNEIPENTCNRETVLQELNTVLAGDNSLSRCCAVRAMGKLHADDEQSTQHLIGLLRDPDPDVRLDAANVLGQLKVGAAVQALVENLENDPEGDVRIQAVTALSAIQSEATVEPLIRCFVEDGYPDLDLVVDDLEYNACWEVQSRALEALGNTGDQRAVSPLMEILEDSGYGDLQDSGYRVLAQLNSAEAKRFLLRQLRKGEPLARRRAALALTGLGGSERDSQELPGDVLTALTNALVDSEAGVRQYAARALGNTHNPLIAVPLLMLVNDPDLEVRKEVAHILGGIRAGELLERLHPMLDEPKIETKRQVAGILGEIGDPASVEPLSALLDVKDADLKYEVIVALGKIGALGPQHKLAGLLADDETHYTIRIAAARALGPILAQIPKSTETDQSIDEEPSSQDDSFVRRTLAEAVFNDDQRIGHAALSSLVESEPDMAVARLTCLLRENRLPRDDDENSGKAHAGIDEGSPAHSEDVSDAEGQAVPEPLRELLRGHSAETSTLASILAAQPQPQPPTTEPEQESTQTEVGNSVRILAARLLGSTLEPGSPAVEVLLAACDDPDPELARVAVETLGNVRDERALPTFIRKLDAEQSEIKLAAVGALGRFDRLLEATDGLSRLLDDSDSFLRRRAVQALGAIGGPQAAKYLPRMLEDEDRDVCRAALSSMTAEMQSDNLSDRVTRLIFVFSGELRTEAGAALRRMTGRQGASKLLDILREKEQEEYHWMCIDALAEIFMPPPAPTDRHAASPQG